MTFRSRVLDEISRLDPVRDHQRIVFLFTRVDFPFDTTRALELALFRTLGVRMGIEDIPADDATFQTFSTD